MTDPTTPSPREVRARIIDPDAWKSYDMEHERCVQWPSNAHKYRVWADVYVAPSLAKADQILALTTPTGMDETQARELLAFTMASRGCKPENVEAVRHACNGHIVKVSADLAVAAIQAALSKGSVRQ